MTGLHAQSQDFVYDTTNFKLLNEVVVSGVRVQKNAPFAVTNINKVELNNFSKTGRELPFLFSRTPGIIAWSENGVGTGTSYMRIRGAADSRINVTLDGVPLNSPEDQCVFWANMNSYGALLGNIQIQRGVGTSTNGDGAFGGTVAMSTATPSLIPTAEITGSYGSFNTLNFGAKASTGLLWNHLIIDGAYHQTNTDGFIHGLALVLKGRNDEALKHLKQEYNPDESYLRAIIAARKGDVTTCENELVKAFEKKCYEERIDNDIEFAALQ